MALLDQLEHVGKLGQLTRQVLVLLFVLKKHQLAWVFAKQFQVFDFHVYLGLLLGHRAIVLAAVELPYADDVQSFAGYFGKFLRLSSDLKALVDLANYWVDRFALRNLRPVAYLLAKLGLSASGYLTNAIVCANHDVGDRVDTGLLVAAAYRVALLLGVGTCIRPLLVGHLPFTMLVLLHSN